jgi:hypothetical protein
MKRPGAQLWTFNQILTRLESENAERLLWVRGKAPNE